MDEQDITIEPENNEELGGKDPKEEVKKLKEKIKTLEEEKKEYLSGWQRAKADYANLLKEHEEKRKEFGSYGASSVIEEVIPALDAFDMATANKEAWEKVDANWRSGVEYIQKTLLKALEKFSVVIENPLGNIFDANKHQSVSTIPTTEKEKDHTVAEVVQKGYKIGDKWIRPALVKVYEYHNS